MHLLRHQSIIFLILFLFQTFLFANLKSIQKDSLAVIFSKIETLANEKEKFPEAFLNAEYLLAKSKKVKGTEKVSTLLDLFTTYIYKSTSEAKNFNDRALKLAEAIEFKSGILQAHYNKAYLKFVKGDFDGAMQLAAEAEKDLIKWSHSKTKADFSTLKSDIFTERGEYDKALETGLKLLNQAEKTGDEYVFMKAYAALSHFYLRTEDYSKALEYCLKGLEYILQLKQTQYLFPKIDEIARMMAKLNNPKRALEAYSFYSKLEKKLVPPGDYIQSIVYMNMADIFINNGEYDKAHQHLSKALRMNYENNYLFRIPRALILQAELDLKKNDTLGAISNYEKSIDAAERIDAFDVVKNNSAILIELFERTNQVDKVKEYKNLFRLINDSLFTNEKEQKIIILESRRRIKEITDMQHMLEAENEQQKIRERNIMVLLLFFLIVSGITTYSYLKVKGKNKLLFNRTIELAEMHLSLEKQPKSNQNDETSTSSTIHKKKIGPAIDEDLKNIILTKLNKLEKDNFFLDQNCSLRSLSEKLRTNPKYLSQVINQEKKTNFNGYINELRITFLLSKLLKDKEFRNSKLSFIAGSIGYNNLNTFNTAFKKRQGILPSYFINKLNEEESRQLDS